MKLLPVIFKRQIATYACTPGTYLSIAIFLVLSVTLGLYTSPWLERDTHHLGMLRSTCRTAAASRNFLGTHRYLPKNDRCFVY